MDGGARNRFLFTGDGLYPGDGGAELQRIWRLEQWRPLPACDGRFVMCGHALRSMPLHEIASLWGVRTASPFLRCEATENKDAVDVVRFVGGGGLLSYCKRGGGFVHTLNTESGLCRKLIALDAHGLLSRSMPDAETREIFAALGGLIARIPEPERTSVAPAVAVAMRIGLARASAQPLECMPCDITEPPPPQRRSVDFLLQGESVRTNRHLARFAAAPYLGRMLAEPAFSPMLSRKSKQLRKELIEAYAALEALEATFALGAPPHKGGLLSTPLPRAPPPRAAVDLCCGKGFLSLVLAHEYPWLPILMVDSNSALKMQHVDALPNLSFMRADVLSPTFSSTLSEAVDAASLATSAGSPRAPEGASGVVAVGVHLCGPLAHRAIDLFGASRALTALLLVPCCLDRRTDGALKLQAKLQGVDPYELKVEQLTGLMEAHTVVCGVHREDAMRTAGGGEATEGSAACKNAFIIGLKAEACPVPSAGPSTEGEAAMAACERDLEALVLGTPWWAQQQRRIAASDMAERDKRRARALLQQQRAGVARAAAAPGSAGKPNAPRRRREVRRAPSKPPPWYTIAERHERLQRIATSIEEAVEAWGAEAEEPVEVASAAGVVKLLAKLVLAGGLRHAEASTVATALIDILSSSSSPSSASAFAHLPSALHTPPDPPVLSHPSMRSSIDILVSWSIRQLAADFDASAGRAAESMYLLLRLLECLCESSRGRAALLAAPDAPRLLGRFESGEESLAARARALLQL